MSEAADRLYQMLNGFRVTQMVRTAALLGICDALAGGPRTAADVATEAGADPMLLRRLMRALAGLGALVEGTDGRFSNAAIGELLRKDAPGSMRNMAVGLVDDTYWEAWRQLPQGVRGGAIPFELAHDKSMWDMVAADPAFAARFNGFMAAQTAIFVPQLLDAFDFSTCTRVVDVGGGTGALIAGILAAHPPLNGTLFDLDAGLEGAEAYLRERGVADRCVLEAGNFFESIPEGGDAYLLKLILHDWDDERATAILKTCRRAMRPGARLLVMDHILPEIAVDGLRERVALTMDLHMYVLFGARERTESQLRTMLADTGFRVERIVPTAPPSSIVATAV